MPDTTLIPLLEPMAGAGLTVSLAYLALDRFRYRRSVEDHARSKQKQFASANDDDTVEVVKDLRWLCRKECNGHTPRGFGANFYHYIFRNQADEFVIAGLALLAGLTLVTGVAISADIWPWAKALDGPLSASLFFYACLGAIGVPAISVLCGRRSVRWGNEFADHCEREITKIHQASARKVSAPPVREITGLSPEAARRIENAIRKRQLPPS